MLWDRAHRQPGAQGDRLAGPAHEGDLRPVVRRRPRRCRTREDRPGARPVLRGHQGGLAARQCGRAAGPGRARRAGVRHHRLLAAAQAHWRRLHATDVTNASRTLLLDIGKVAWDDELLAALRVPAAVLPEVRPSSQVYAETDPARVLRGRRTRGRGDRRPAGGPLRASLFRAGDRQKHLRHRLFRAR